MTDKTAKARELLDADIADAVETIKSAGQLLYQAGYRDPTSLAVQGRLATALESLNKAHDVLLEAGQREALAAAKTRGDRA